MHDFWDQSWENVNPDRLRAYIAGYDCSSDALIETLRAWNVQTVCDAGCGCGIHALRLAANGFFVSGFDLSTRAVQIAQDLVREAGFSADFKPASILQTGYADETFDFVLSRDVLDHLPMREARQGLLELCRIAKKNGRVLATFDSLDEEYLAQPHIVNADGDFLYTDGKWKGMYFHAYDRPQLDSILPEDANCEVRAQGGEWIVSIVRR